MDKDIQKPLTVAVKEFKENIESAVNSSGLPPFIIYPIFEGYLRQIGAAAQRQYEREKAEYEKAISLDKSN